MRNYVTCELSEDGVVQISERPCQLSIQSDNAYILHDKAFLSEYIRKYGRYIGLLFGGDTFDYTSVETLNNKGIVAFLQRG